VGLIDQLIGGHSTPRTHFCTRLMPNAQNWSFVVLNSLAKVNKNKVITFERLKISLKSFMGIHNTRHQVQWCDCQVGHRNTPLFFSSMGPFFSS
jgi:hypothetical protein